MDIAKNVDKFYNIQVRNEGAGGLHLHPTSVGRIGIASHLQRWDRACISFPSDAAHGGPLSIHFRRKALSSRGASRCLGQH